MTADSKEPLAGVRVLIVEDEYYLADDLSRTLILAGARVIGPAGSLDDAERIIGEGGFDCAVLDMNLRGNFSYAIAERLHDAGVPFLIATGYNLESLPETLTSAPRVEKPFDPQEVVDRLVTLRENSA